MKCCHFLLLFEWVGNVKSLNNTQKLAVQLIKQPFYQWKKEIKEGDTQGKRHSPLLNIKPLFSVKL